MSERKKLLALLRKTETEAVATGLTLRQLRAAYQFFKACDLLNEHDQAEKQRRFFESLDNDPAFYNQ